MSESGGLDFILDNAPMQDGSEWKNKRIGAFTSSKMKVLVGKARSKDVVFSDGAMTYIYQKVWERMTGHECSNFDGNAATEWGTQYEDEAIREFERVTGLKVQTAPYISKSLTYGGSPDGFVVGEDATVEVKCPYAPENFIRAVDGVIKPEYIIQDQSNMNVTGKSKCYHITYDPRMPEGKRMVYKILERDEEMISLINERLVLADAEADRIIKILEDA